MARLGELQEALDRQDGWRLEQRVEDVIVRLDLPADAPVNTLSGGQRRRVLLAQALVRQPDVLLLDEPTNHLDIDSIEWLEAFLREYTGALLFVTHDRALLRSLATRIVELDRGSLRSYPGNYDTYLSTREAEQDAEAQAEQKFDKLLAREEVWIRQGIKARRTRDEGRVRALEAMRRERAQRREKAGTVQLAVDDSERSGRAGARGASPAASVRRSRHRRATSAAASCAATASASSARTDRARRRCCGCCSGTLPVQAGRGAPRHQPRDRVLRPGARATRPGRHA